MKQNQLYLIKSGQNSFVETEDEVTIGLSGGNIGFGTTTPEVFMHVTGDAQIDGDLTVKGNFTTVDSTTIQVDDKNIEIGVGATTDAAADGGGITLHGATDKTITWSNANDAWTSSEHIHTANGKHVATDQVRAINGDGLKLYDDGGNGIFVEDGGNVGIGNTAPAYDLDVNGSGSFSNSLYVGGYRVYTTSDGAWKWQDSGDDIYYIAGKVGIANDSPGYNLHVSGDTAVDGNFIVNGASGNLNVSELNVSGDYVHVNYSQENLSNDRGGLKVSHTGVTNAATLDYLSSSDHWQFNKKLQVLGDLDVQNNLIIGGNDVIDQGDVGSEPNQIPLNKDLGSLAYMDAPQIEDLNVDTLELREMAAEISDTAVDVFVYDTRRDSDGGAWRSRTQHTSWYNEELNTVTRGGRREFPAVAVIVAEADKVTIYDGDDPDLNMWMVFEGQFVADLKNCKLVCWANNSGGITSCGLLNGLLGIGTGGNGGLIAINFVKDFSRYYRTEDSSYTGAIYSGNISKRNTLNYSWVGDYNEFGIVNDYVNDVAMTILPNAPIDDDTGLPIPTIAVATDGGVSVIKDDGSVVDITELVMVIIY